MVAHRKHMIVRMQYLQRSQLSEKAVRISRDSPLFRLQREISGVLYLQRIAVISSDTAVLADPAKTHADRLIPMQK